MISIYGGWMDVIIFNILFWLPYMWLCSLPAKLVQKAIDEA